MAADRGILELYVDGDLVQTFTLAGETVAMGRAPENNLCLRDPMVSRRHAELRFGAEGLYLMDTTSSSGTFIAGEKLPANQPHLLTPGTTFRIGSFSIVYLDAALKAGTASPRAVSSGPGEPGPSPTPAPPAPSLRPAHSDERAALEGNASGRFTGTPTPPAGPPELPPRPTFPAPPAGGAGSRYLAYLPSIFSDDDFLGRYLQIMETLWEPLEWRQDLIHAYFDPRTAPAGLLPWLARWFAVTLDERWPEWSRRRFLQSAFELYRWRGTEYGLSRFLETCVGVVPVIRESREEPFVFRIRVALPPGCVFDRGMLEELIEAHKPAHVGYVLEIE